MTFETGRFAAVVGRLIDEVRSAEDVAEIVRLMHVDLVASGQGGWENGTLELFLEALAALLADGTPGEPLTWKTAAHLLVAASGYE